MAEKGSEENISKGSAEEKKVGRGKFLRVGAAAAIGGALGLAGAREVATIKSGIVETEGGIFVPMYEHHEISVGEKLVPEDINIFFTEFATNETGPEVLFAKPRIRERLISDNVLKKLSKQHTEIMFGDVIPPGFWESFMISYGERFAGFGLTSYALWDKLTGGKEVNSSRRKFLRGAALMGGAWGVSPLASAVVPATTSLVENLAVRRIGARIHAMPANLHPEDTILFFRSLVIADKLLIAAQEYQKRTGQKPKIAYEVGAAHGNIEDFLQAGPDFVRSFILAYPDDVLKEAVKLNGSIENFSTAKFYKLPTGIENLGSDELKEKVLEKVETRSVTDEKLAQSLHVRFKGED